MLRIWLSFFVVFFSGNKLAAASFEEWLEQQERVSRDKMLANIHPAGTSKGVVIASPSKDDPNYFFHWIRDAALTMDVVVSLYNQATTLKASEKYWDMIWDYVYFSRDNQQSQAMTGLGEPKFFVDGNPYDGPWGRPQNDGPALRAYVLIKFARILVKLDQEQSVRKHLTTLIKTDLDYVASHWQEHRDRGIVRSFDLWEEVQGDHFYTRFVQRRALLDGAKFAKFFQDKDAAARYGKQAELITKELRHHWDDSKKIYRVTMNRPYGDYKNSEIDVAVLLSYLHVGSDEQFPLTDDKLLSTVQKMIDAFNSEYRINQQSLPGVAIGRYPEDRYTGYAVDGNRGGNPWFLATLGLAEFYYRLADELALTKKFAITPHNKSFFNFALSKTGSTTRLKSGDSLKLSSTEQKRVVKALKQFADDCMKRVQYHMAKDGSMSEQYNRSTGFMQGAYDLTWSYAAFLTAKWER